MLIADIGSAMPTLPPALTDAATPALVSLAFGSGLLPSLVSANKAAFASLSGFSDEQLTAPTRGSLGGSKPLKFSPLLAYPAPVLIDDVLDIVGRFSATDTNTALAKLL